MKRPVLLILLLLACGIPGQACHSERSEESRSFGKHQDDRKEAPESVKVSPMTVERLPDLNVPRSAHVLAYVNGELTVIGGHTTGFVPTATAEYFHDGKWQLIDSYFPHDFGFGVVLPSEEVLVGCGCAEPFGEGLTMGMELYNPVFHSFSPLPITDQRRVHASAAELSNGIIAISGNWYYGDYISTYSPESGGSTIRRAEYQKANPYIFQTSPDNAFVLSSIDTSGAKTGAMVERLRGESVEVPLLSEWEDLFRPDSQMMSQFFIGDETVSGYAWLFPAIRKADGQLGLLKLVGEDFSVMETERPLSVDLPEGETLIRQAFLLADNTQKSAWVIRPVSGAERIYVFKVDYGQALRGGKAPVTVYQADLPDGISAPKEVFPALLPGGRIALIGGRTGYDEYHPSATAFILHTEPVPAKRSLSYWLGLLAGILCASALVLISWRLQVVSAKKKKADEVQQGEVLFTDMMTRIRSLMEEKELFRKPDLKVEDLAAELGTNVAYVRGCIGGAYGGTFSDFVNEYRIRYVQRLLLENPTAKITALAEDAGFSSNATFYRHFTALTGLSPAAWLKQQQQ